MWVRIPRHAACATRAHNSQLQELQAGGLVRDDSAYIVKRRIGLQPTFAMKMGRFQTHPPTCFSREQWHFLNPIHQATTPASGMQPPPPPQPIPTHL